MDTRLRKVWKDLAERKARSLTTLAGLAIGLWGIGTVSIAWLVLSNDLGENYARTLPPDLIVQADPGPIPPLDGITGLEAFDVMHNWLQDQERQGEFRIADPKLRKAFYH